MYSVGLINAHFWMATIGVVVYIVAMWISGIMQGLMWRAVNPDGSLTYTFAESVAAMHPYYMLRLMGGLIYFSGMLVMAYNVVMTARAVEVEAAVEVVEGGIA
jgi:cytochrome c oxidase cbb3-type subunit 1